MARPPRPLRKTGERGPRARVQGRYSKRLSDAAAPDRHETFRLSHEFFLQVLASLEDYAVFTLDRNGIVSSWNRGAQRVFGYREGEIIGRSSDILFTKEDIADERPREERQTAEKEGKSLDEAWHVRKDGTVFWASGVVFPLKDGRGRVRGFTKIARDLTQQRLTRKTELALRASEAKYRSLFESIDEGFCIIEVIFDAERRPVDYRFLEVNPAFEHQTGLANAAGRTIRELAPGHEEHWFQIYGRIALGGEPARFESQAAALNRWYDVYAWRYGAPRGNQVAVLFKDITARKRQRERLEAAVKERTEDLRRTVADLEAFSYTVSHDLRAPLRAIQGYAYLILEKARGCLEPEAVALLERIEASSARMDRMVKDILLFSQVGREKPVLGPTDLDPVVAHIVETYERIRSERVTVKSPLGIVRGHETLLAQAVSNLVENAVKFVPDDREPEATIRAERAGRGRLRLIVEDNGIGIAPEHRGRIFAPFVRLASGKYDGTGIGLAIVKKAVEAMGGEVGVVSQPGKGSRFWIELPEASHAA